MEQVRKRILLVEDEFLIAMMETKTLEGNGYEVVHAGNASSAIERSRSDPAFDLVLMDIDLGKGMDGTEAATLILAERDVPLAFLSSHSERSIVERTEGISSYGYILKNAGDTVLLASVKMAFRLSEARREERRKAEALTAKVEELERFHNITVDRELRMVDLKKEVNELLGLMGKPDRYRIPERDDVV